MKIFADAITLKKYYNSIAIITKTAAEAKALKDRLEGKAGNSNFKLVTAKDKVFQTEKIMIIPSYLAKGLEFDVALLFDVTESNYKENNKLLLYTACTRALHKLNIYHSGELSKLIKIR